MLESLWIDKPDAEDTIADMLSNPSEVALGWQLENFRKHGFCVIRQAIPHATIDRYVQELDNLIEGDRLKISLGLEIKLAKGSDLMVPLTKVLDPHVLSEAAQQIAFAQPLHTFLERLFGDHPLAFQSLHFQTGSTQAVHNDTAYVVLDEPKSLTASWVALEDVQLGSGELVYYPGSHRFNDFMYADGRKHWSQKDDGHAIHNHHLSWLHQEATARGLTLEHFLPRKGDVLFWHADLAHGGGAITREGSTRKSLVTHYCPVRCKPHYFQFISAIRRLKQRAASEAEGYVSSFYYDLAKHEAVGA